RLAAAKAPAAAPGGHRGSPHAQGRARRRHDRESTGTQGPIAKRCQARGRAEPGAAAASAADLAAGASAAIGTAAAWYRRSARAQRALAQRRGRSACAQGSETDGDRGSPYAETAL